MNLQQQMINYNPIPQGAITPNTVAQRKFPRTTSVRILNVNKRSSISIIKIISSQLVYLSICLKEISFSVIPVTMQYEKVRQEDFFLDLSELFKQAILF